MSFFPAAVPAEATRSSSWLRLVLLGLVYGLSWQLLLHLSHALWFLPAGLRLGCLWLTPRRHWHWLAAGEWIGASLFAYSRHESLTSAYFFATNFAPMLLYMAVVWTVRGAEPHSGIDRPRRMGQLLGTGALCALLVSPTLSHFQPADGLAQRSWAGTFAFLYGDVIGQLVLAPVLVLFAQPGRRLRLPWQLWRDMFLQLLFSALLIFFLHRRPDLAPYLLLLAYVPIFFTAFLHGWEGAAVAVALTGLVVQGMVQIGLPGTAIGTLQLTLAVVGIGGLMLGTAISELRRSGDELHRQHQELRDANQSLEQIAGDLRLVSQRLVRLEEQGQRELAGELDYELGQAIHALGTRISLAFRDARDEQTLRLLESVREQVREMQDSLRRVLRRLRPPVLDTHGLREAVGFGPLRDMLEDAGIAFVANFYGRIEALDDDAQTAIYRICQAAILDAAHRESVREVHLKLSVLPGRAHCFQIELLVDVHASPYLEFPLEVHPLPAISDRVLALDGQYGTEALSPGLRHQVQFEHAGQGVW